MHEVLHIGFVHSKANDHKPIVYRIYIHSSSQNGQENLFNIVI